MLSCVLTAGCFRSKCSSFSPPSANQPGKFFAVSEICRGNKISKDNPTLDRLIVVGTKALGRVLMSGETLRAPRQQLRRLRASAFDFSNLKSFSFPHCAPGWRAFVFLAGPGMLEKDPVDRTDVLGIPSYA